jgi:hypothetical protein
MDRYEIAWRIWCWQEGYTNPIDREGMENWMRGDVQHPDDIRDRDALLEIADEVIALANV